LGELFHLRTRTLKILAIFVLYRKICATSGQNGQLGAKTQLLNSGSAS